MDIFWQWFRKLVAAPIFRGDAEKTRTAAVINTILWAGLIAVPLSLLTGLSAPLRAGGLILRVVMVLTCTGILWSTHRGFVRESASALVILLWGIAAAGTWMWGGLRSNGPFLFVIPLVTAGLFLKRRTIFLIAALNAACGLAFIGLEYSGSMPALAGNDPFSLWVSQTISFSWVAFTLFYVMRDRDQAANDVINENKSVQQVRQLLEERNLRLQQTVQTYIDHMARVGAGDLTQAVPLQAGSTEDPLVLLGQQLNDLTASLRRMILVTRDATGNLVVASSQIQAAAAQQVEGITEQTGAIADTTSMVNDVRRIAISASQNAVKLSSVSEESVDVARDGRASIESTISSMNQIKEHVQAIASNIQTLASQTQQIGEILSTVNDIAMQSNMLALNASVEAARAQTDGKGFAVVAGEVRALSEQSRRATLQIRLILGQVQKGTRASVEATQVGVDEVLVGMQRVNQTRQVIEKLVSAIDETAQVSLQLAAGSQQQLSSIERASAEVQKIQQIARKSQVSTQETKKAADTLNRLAHDLTEIIRPYQAGS